MSDSLRSTLELSVQSNDVIIEIDQKDFDSTFILNERNGKYTLVEVGQKVKINYSSQIIGYDLKRVKMRSKGEITGIDKGKLIFFRIEANHK